MKPLSLKTVGLLVVLCINPLFAQMQQTQHPQERMGWWREARFGMLIHWGLYAVPAGEYEANKWKSTETLVRNLIDIASKGGNYLLNIGPKADGTFPQASVERLRGMGQWMSVNAESLHGTKAALFKPAWGRVTRKPGTLYLHVFNWPTNGKLTMPALSNRLGRASLLAQPETALLVNTDDATWVIQVPTAPVDPIATVIAIDVEGEPTLRK